MDMLVFLLKASERSLHYKSRSKSPGLLMFLTFPKLKPVVWLVSFS